jgi:hypothetical protein
MPEIKTTMPKNPTPEEQEERKKLEALVAAKVASRPPQTAANATTVKYTNVEDLKKDMGMFDPATMTIRCTLAGKGVSAGWQLKGVSKRELGELLAQAYGNWKGDVHLTFEPPMERDELEGLSPRSVSVVKLANAAYKGDLETVKSLVSSNVDVDAVVAEKGNNSALNFAGRGGHVHVLKWLLANGAFHNARNGFDETPLMCAANRAYGNICKVLIEHGADVNAVDENGYTALDFLGVGGSDRKKDCRQVLKQAGCMQRAGRNHRS